MLEYMPYVWTLLLILSVAVEAATVSLTAIWFMPAGLICLVMSIFTVSITAQIITYLVVGILTFVLAKTVFGKYFSKVGRTPTNADRIIGQIAVVTKPIDNETAKGEVLVNGQYWSARSDGGEPISENTRVMLLRIEGVKVIVSPV